MLSKLQEHVYKGHVAPVRKRQRVTDEDLMDIFETLKGKWFEVEVLSKTMGDLVPVNDSNPKRSAFSSGYLKRLSRLTGKRWRQKSGIGDEGKRLVKIYVEPTRR